jgi:hypothetical protein
MGFDLSDLDPFSSEFLGGYGKYTPFTGYGATQPGGFDLGNLFPGLGGGAPAETAAAMGLPGLPTLTDEVVLRRQLERKQKLAAMRGRASTFLTGPRGVGLGLPSSDIASAFLKAKLAERDDIATTTAQTAPIDTGEDEAERRKRAADIGSRVGRAISGRHPSYGRSRTPGRF